MFYRKKVKNDPANFSAAAKRDNKPVIPSTPLGGLETSMDDLVHEFLEAQNLSILPENQLMQAVGIFVEKDDKEAIKEYFVY